MPARKPPARATTAGNKYHLQPVAGSRHEGEGANRLRLFCCCHPFDIIPIIRRRQEFGACGQSWLAIQLFEKRDFSVRTMRCGSAGFTLIEILISMFLLAIGFLGLAAVQSKSLAETQNTQFRSKANILLRDIADRMRANSEAVAQGDYVIDAEAVSTGEPPADCAYAPSAYTCIAQRDLTVWMNAVDDALPAPHVLIADAGAGVQRIRIDWLERNAGAGSNAPNPCGEDDRACTEVRIFIN
jgi:type IV pilus assembly protein PilV